MIVEKKHSISVISGSCGIKPHTIRIWEKRYNLFSPGRNDKGRRLYSDEDINKAKMIVELMKHGHGISALAQYSASELEQLIISKRENPILNSSNIDRDQMDRLYKHLSDYNLKGLSQELQYARLNTSAREFVLDLVLPIIRDIGLKVATGDYSITQEHIISTIIRDQLSQIFLPNLNEQNCLFAFATPEGNLHEFSILIADIITRSHRFSTRYLGATHPADCLAQALNALKTPILVLGVISSDKWDYQKNMIPYLRDLDKELHYQLEVILGGGYEIEFPEFEKLKSVKVMKTFEQFDDYLEKLT